MYFTYFEGVSGNLLHERESQIVPPGRIQLRTPQKRDHCREAYCPGYIPWCGLGTRSMLYTQAKQLASRGGWLAMKRGQLSNEQLAEQLRWYGETPGPITGTTRGVYQQKLAKLLRQNTQFSPNRRLKSDPLYTIRHSVCLQELCPCLPSAGNSDDLCNFMELFPRLSPAGSIIHHHGSASITFLVPLYLKHLTFFTVRVVNSISCDGCNLLTKSTVQSLLLP